MSTEEKKRKRVTVGPPTQVGKDGSPEEIAEPPQRKKKEPKKAGEEA